MKKTWDSILLQVQHLTQQHPPVFLFLAEAPHPPEVALEIFSSLFPLFGFFVWTALAQFSESAQTLGVSYRGRRRLSGVHSRKLMELFQC